MIKVNKVLYEDENHRNIVIELLEKYKKIYAKYDNEIDLEYYPAFYLLSASMLKDKTLKYITLDGIDFNSMLKEDFSSGQTLLIRLARELFNNGDNAPIIDLIGTLDELHWGLALEAIKLRRHALKLSEI